MFGNLVADKVVTAVTLFARCFSTELEIAQTPPEMREQLATLFDNAMVRYQRARPDPTTQTIITRVRPLVRAWLVK